jgi:hypothetical protein
LGAGEAAIGLRYGSLGFIIQSLYISRCRPLNSAFNERFTAYTSMWQLMTFFIEILKTVGGMPFVRFYIVWTTVTAAAVIYMAWMVGRATTPVVQQVKIAPIRHTRTPRSVWRGRLTALALGAFLVCYIALILRWEDFAYYDNSAFTGVTLLGSDLWPSIARGGGRFFPLAQQEFNLIRRLTHTNTGYHLLPIAQLLIFSFILLILDSELGITARAALAMLALLTPSVLISFSELLVPERNILFFLVCLVLFVKRFEQTQSIAWAVAAAVCAQFMIYYKETAFVLLLGFAVARLILRCRNGRDATWDYDRLWCKESRLDLCFAGLAVLFLAFYVAVMGLHGNMGYAVEHRQPLAEIVLAYLRLDLVAWLLLAVALGRIYLILRQRATPSLLWDGLAFGGVACLLAYVVGLRMFGAIYLAPVDLIAVLYVGRLAVLSWKKMRWWGKLAASMLAFTVLLQDVSFSTFAVFERKNDIHAKAEIASIVKTQYRSGAGNGLRLFFPFASPYVIKEFASYLNYRGVPVEGAVGKADGLGRVVLATRAFAEDGPCFVSGITCRAVGGPAPGDLVIVLPDDEASLAEANVYRERGELLFFYEPYPSIPHWLYSLAAKLVGSITIAAVRFAHKTLSDRWMDASVTVWE